MNNPQSVYTVDDIDLASFEYKIVPAGDACRVTISSSKLDRCYLLPGIFTTCEDAAEFIVNNPDKNQLDKNSLQDLSLLQWALS